MATSGLSWSSEFGPRPEVTPWVVTNGLAGPSMRQKKKADTMKSTRMAQRMTGSGACDRKRQLKMVVKTESASPHSRIDPARADHNPVMEYSSGVTVLLFCATK